MLALCIARSAISLSANTIRTAKKFARPRLLPGISDQAGTLRRFQRSRVRRAMRNDPQRVIRGAEVLSLPLSYPDPAHEFLGYVNEPVASTDGYVGPGTRDLVSYLYGMLIPLLSCQTEGYVVSKEEAFRRFPQLRPGVLGDFIAEAWERCRPASSVGVL